MIVLTIVRSSSRMCTVAPVVVSDIFEKTGAYVNTMFLQKLAKIGTKIINKLPVAMETVSRAILLASFSYF